MSGTQSATGDALWQVYSAWVNEHPRAAEEFSQAVEDTLTDAGVNFDGVVARVKSWDSLAVKAQKRRADGSLSYPDPWRDIHDILGVRVTVLHSNEIPVVLDILGGEFNVLRSVDKAQETKVSGGFGYGSHHLVVEVPPECEGLEVYAGVDFEVQIRTVLQHAWAEFEHDIRYKRGGAVTDPQVDRAFTLAAGLIELADQQFDQIATLYDPEALKLPESEVELSAETLPGILAVLIGTRFPRSRLEHYRWLAELLHAHGLTTINDLAELLNEADIGVVTQAMNYHYQPGQVRIIDDLLLNRFGNAHVKKTGNTGNRAAQRPRRLKQRLKLLRSAQEAET